MNKLIAFLALLVACVGCDQKNAPVDLIDYTIAHREEFHEFKISFDVRVPLVNGRLPTTDELGAISKHLRSQEKKHDRMFVCFYLPGMKVDSGAFATAHHDPNLEVKILRETSFTNLPF